MVYFFNKTLATARGLSEEDMKAMQKVYELMYQTLARPSMHCNTPKEAVEVIQGLEYTLQLFWKFPTDKSFHNFWFELKGCTCPKMDNRERAGSGAKIVAENCPYHCSDRLAETWEDRRFG